MIWVGTDLVHVPSFVAQLAQPGSRFLAVFTAGERRDAQSRADQSASLAARWAAKEAFVKAWSSSMWGSHPVLDEQVHHLVEVVCDAWNRPSLVVHGEVAKWIASAGLGVSSLSLSHDGDYATATVLLTSKG